MVDLLGRNVPKPEDEDEQQSPLFEGDTPAQSYDPNQLEKNLTHPKGEESKGLTPEELQEKEDEDQPGWANPTAVGDKEAALGDEPEEDKDSLYNPDDANSSPGGKFKGLLKKALTKRNAGLFAGGGGVIGLILFLGFNFAAYESVLVKENMLGRGNTILNQAISKRQQKNFLQLSRNLNKNSRLGKLLNSRGRQNFVKRMKANNIDVKFDGSSGKLNELSYEFDKPDGTKGKHSFDFDKPFETAKAEFLDHPDFGPEVRASLDKSLNPKALNWRGKPTRRLWGGRLRTTLSNWVGTSRKKKNDPNKTQDNAQNIGEADVSEHQEPAQRSESGFREEYLDENGDGQVSDAERKSVEQQEIKAQSTEGQEKGQEAAKKGEPVDAPVEMSDALGDAIVTEFEGSDSAAVTRESLEGFSRKAASEGIAVTESFSKGIGIAFNATETFRLACKAKGTIRWVTNLRNVYLSIKMAKWATRYLSAADYQKAGVAKAASVDLLMTWMHKPNPKTGRSYTQSGGFQNIIMGNKSSKPSKAALARYSVGRGPGGFWGGAERAIDKFWATDTKHCKIYTNKYYVAGGTILGIVGAVASGGTMTAGQVALAGSMFVIEQAIDNIGAAQAKRAIGDILINPAKENGEMAGEALASGWGALRGMDGGINGFKPVTKERAASLTAQAKQDHQYEMSHESLFARYFDMSNADSMVANMGFAFAGRASLGSTGVFAQGLNLLAPAKLVSNIGGVMNLFPGSAKVHAEASDNETQCDDPQVTKYKLEADVFCNVVQAESPDLDLEKTEDLLRKNNLIDEDGNPIDKKKEKGKDTPKDDLHDFIVLCHSGRPAILYRENPDKNGGTAPADGTCADDGPMDDKGNKTSDFSLPGDDVGRYLRFSQWYGYKQDEGNLLEDLNQDYKTVSADNGTYGQDPEAIPIPAGCPGGPAEPPAPNTRCPTPDCPDPSHDCYSENPGPPTVFCPDGKTNPIPNGCPGDANKCPDGSTPPVGVNCSGTGPGIVYCPDGKTNPIPNGCPGTGTDPPYNPTQKCPKGSTDSAPEEGFANGQSQGNIQLCRLDSKYTLPGYAVKVNLDVAAKTIEMLDAAIRDSVSLQPYSGFRSNAEQEQSRRDNCNIRPGHEHEDIYSSNTSCDRPVARPGYSNHQMGVALDIGSCIGPSGSARDRDTECYRWMNAHAKDYSYFNLPSEAYHWSKDGH